MKTPTAHRLLLSAVLMTIGTPLFAQLQPASPAPTSPPAEEAPKVNDVVTLQEFTVTSTTSNDYIASESVTGTRVASKIQDLPFNVNVVTGEFIDDFAAYELPDQFAFVSSISPNETQGAYQVRGFESNNQLRNGFRRLGLIDKVNVDRAEVIKGPAASIYGKIQPGGVINILTKKPKSKPQHTVSLAVGSDNFYRAQATSTGPVGKSGKVFYRQDLASSDRRFEQPFKETSQWTSATQLLWKPNADTSLSFEFEYLFRHEKRGNSIPPLIVKNLPDPYRVGATYNRWERLAFDELYSFNHQGPEEFNDRDVYTVSLGLEHRINRTWSLRAGFNWFERSFDRANVSGDAYHTDLNVIANGQSASNRVGVHRPIVEHGTSFQTDLLGSFTTGPVSHKLLFTYDYNRTSDYAFEARMSAAAAANPANISGLLSISNPNYTFRTFAQDPSIYTDLRENLYNSVDNHGLFVSERAAMMQGRLIMMVGARIDWVDNKVVDYLNPKRIYYDLSETTYQMGANFRLFPNLTLFANQSTSFSPQARFNIDGTPLPNETGLGSEAGLKVNFLDNKFSMSVTVFDIERKNIARETTTTDPTTFLTERVVILSGKEQARGVEMDFNWQATEELQFLGGYGNVVAKTLENKEFPFLSNTTPRRVPRHNVGFASRYEFKYGALKGLYATVGMKYYSASLVNAGSGRTLQPSLATAGTPLRTLNVINARHGNGALLFPDQPENAIVVLRSVWNPATLSATRESIRVGDGRESIMNAGYSAWEASVGYRWRDRPRKLSHKVQVNVKNLFDTRYTWGSGVAADPFTVIGTYSLTF